MKGHLAYSFFQSGCLRIIGAFPVPCVCPKFLMRISGLAIRQDVGKGLKPSPQSKRTDAVQHDARIRGELWEKVNQSW